MRYLSYRRCLLFITIAVTVTLILIVLSFADELSHEGGAECEDAANPQDPGDTVVTRCSTRFLQRSKNNTAT